MESTRVNIDNISKEIIVGDVLLCRNDEIR